MHTFGTGMHAGGIYHMQKGQQLGMSLLVQWQANKTSQCAKESTRRPTSSTAGLNNLMRFQSH